MMSYGCEFTSLLFVDLCFIEGATARYNRESGAPAIKNHTTHDTPSEKQVFTLANNTSSSENITNTLIVKHNQTNPSVIAPTEPNTKSNVQDLKYSNTSKLKCVLETDLVTHMRFDDKTRKFICNICNLNYEYKKQLQHHLLNHAEIKSLFCDISDNKTNVNNHLKHQKRTHTGEKPYHCDMCNYKCSLKIQLTSHIIRTHRAVKRFSCEICKYKSSIKSNLKSHLKKHSGDKPFHCEMCSFKFSHKCNLKSHITRIHSGDKPFICEKCDYMCLYKSQFIIHSRIHTGEKPFICEKCDYKCASKSSLTIHITRIHSGDKPL